MHIKLDNNIMNKNVYNHMIEAAVGGLFPLQFDTSTAYHSVSYFHTSFVFVYFQGNSAEYVT